MKKLNSSVKTVKPVAFILLAVLLQLSPFSFFSRDHRLCQSPCCTPVAPSCCEHSSCNDDKHSLCDECQVCCPSIGVPSSNYALNIQRLLEYHPYVFFSNMHLGRSPVMPLMTVCKDSPPPLSGSRQQIYSIILII